MSVPFSVSYGENLDTNYDSRPVINIVLPDCRESLLSLNCE